MPNYNLVVDSTFQPFSLERYLQPLAIYGRAYNDAADTLDALSVDAGPLQNQINRDTDPDLYNQYNTYMGGLNALVDGMAKNDKPLGSIISDARKLKREYAKNIVPIKEAIARRNEDIKKQQEILINDPTRVFDKVANEISLSEYINNPALDVISANISRELLRKQVSEAAKHYAKTMTSKSGLSSLGLPFQYERALRSGASPIDVYKAMMRDPEASPLLTSIVDNVMASSGMRGWGSMKDNWRENQLYRDVESYAARGLFDAIGETKYETFKDDYSSSLSLEAAKQRLRKQEQDQSPTDAGPLTYRRVENVNVKGDTSKLQADLEFLKSLSGGNIFKLSKDKPSIGSYESSIGAPHKRFSDYEIALQRYKNIAARHGIKTNAWGPNNNKALITKLEDAIKGNVIRGTTYILNVTDADNVGRYVLENAAATIKNGKTQLKKLKDGKLKDSLNQDDLGTLTGTGNKKASNFMLRYEPNTGFVMSYNTEGKTEEVVVPPHLIDPDGWYAAQHEFVQQSIKNKNSQDVTQGIENMMTDLYFRFNTQAPKQTSTSSKI